MQMKSIELYSHYNIGELAIVSAGLPQVCFCYIVLEYRQ